MVARPLCFICSLLLIFSACKKNDSQQCTYYYNHVPAYIGMEGFDTSELHTIYVRQYVPDGTYSQLTRRDTISLDSLSIVGGQAYRYNYPAFFYSLNEGKHYEVEVPAASRTFRIGGVYYHGPASFTVTVSSCLGRTFTEAPDSAQVDGAPVAITGYSGAASYFFLQK